MSADAPDSPPRLDHLVVLADNLTQGVAWCEATLGVTPAPGGEHPLFGTHNRLLALGGGGFPLAYLEIIAINPAAEPRGLSVGRRRWFDMDDETLRTQVRAQGPRLVHWVARVPDLQAASARLAGLDIDRGDVLRANRMTPEGLLGWQITVRPDGRRLMDGGLPTLIEWGDVHPAARLPASGVVLQRWSLHHPRAEALRQALTAIDLGDVPVVPAPTPALHATLLTPRGTLRLSSAPE